MAMYLNPGCSKFNMRLSLATYVDKSLLIKHLNSCICNPDKEYVCVSRPRRFGKTVTADMLCAYYGRDGAGAALFGRLKIAADPGYQKHRSAYDVIFINMSAEFGKAENHIKRLKKSLTLLIGHELRQAYPEADNELLADMDLSQILTTIYNRTKTPFVIIIDEWDCVMRKAREDERSIKKYLDFLEMLFKDKVYIGLAYMTGILPIRKYGAHSALNMFNEYSVTEPGPFAPHLGFTADEVKSLCDAHSLSFEEMRRWYDGYTIGKAVHVFNPNSVIKALDSKKFLGYWTQTETWEALSIYIELNLDGLRDEVVRLMAGEDVKVNVMNFNNDMTNVQDRDDVLTLLTHLGYLSAAEDPDGDTEYRMLRVPNLEIMKEFRRVISRSKRFKETAKAIAESRKLLDALLRGEAEAVAAGVASAHEDHASILKYNDENSLSCVISLAFFSARDSYQLVRELPAGKGYADLAYIPRPGVNRPALLIELKQSGSAEGVIAQIRDRHYPHGLEAWRDNLILAGISYDRESKEHTCVIERA